jgi:opacity protein-like surface antigen
MSGDLIMFAKWRALNLSAVALAGFSVASVASAADLDAVGYEPVVEAQPVEVGSGWYLRGDLGYNISSKTGLTARDQFGNSVSESFDLDKNFVPSVGIGYQFTDYLRADVTGSYSKQDLDGFPAEARIWDMMANAYVDLGNFAGFTPYLGGGLGFANVRYSFDTGAGDFKSDDDYRFAWALMAVAMWSAATASRSATRISSRISCAPVFASRPGNSCCQKLTEDRAPSGPFSVLARPFYGSRLPVEFQGKIFPKSHVVEKCAFRYSHQWATSPHRDACYLRG